MHPKGITLTWGGLSAGFCRYPAASEGESPHGARLEALLREYEDAHARHDLQAEFDILGEAIDLEHMREGEELVLSKLRATASENVRLPAPTAGLSAALPSIVVRSPSLRINSLTDKAQSLGLIKEYGRLTTFLSFASAHECRSFSRIEPLGANAPCGHAMIRVGRPNNSQYISVDLVREIWGRRGTEPILGVTQVVSLAVLQRVHEG